MGLVQIVKSTGYVFGEITQRTRFKKKSKKIPDLDSRFFMISEANSNHLDYLSLKYEIFEKKIQPHIFHS